MSNLVDVPAAVLASLLESIADCEGVLVCRDQPPFMDEAAVERCFGTFAFTSFSGSGDEQAFLHDDSGTTLTYSGTGVTLAIGGQLTEAIPDLLKTLASLGWRNVDVYSVHGHALYEDLTRGMPASVDIQISLREVPADVENDADVAAFAAAVAVRNSDGVTDNDTEFLSVFRSNNGLPVTVAEQPGGSRDTSVAAVRASGASQGMGVGVHVNYIPDTGDVYDLPPGVPATTIATGESMPTPSAERRPIVTLTTASPVAASAVVPAVSRTIATDVPVATKPVAGVDLPAAVARSLVEFDESIGVTAVHNPVSPTTESVPAPMLVTSPTLCDTTGGYLRGVRVPCPSGPVYLGSTVVVLDAPWQRLPDEDLNVLATKNGGLQNLVRYEPGASGRAASGYVWDVLAELPVGEQDSDTALALITAMWPEWNNDHLVLLAMLLMIKAEYATAGTRVPRDVWGDLVSATQGGAGELLVRLDRMAAQGGGLLGVLMSNLRFTLCEELPTRLCRIGCLVWRMGLHAKAATRGCGPRPTLSLTDIVRSPDSRIYVVTIDTLDVGGAGEFLASAVMRWATALAGCRRFVEPAATTAVDRAAASMIETLDPKMVDALARILSQKIAAGPPASVTQQTL